MRALPIFALSLLCAFYMLAQNKPADAIPADSPATASADVPTDVEARALLDRVIANQKTNEAALDIYERMERVEIRKSSGGNATNELKISRVVPGGTGVDHIPVGPDGKPTDESAYRAELEKLEKALAWAAESGSAQRQAYEKMAKRRNERLTLIEATRDAFLFTFIARENHDGRVLLKYRMDPNPAYKPTSRILSIYSRVHGTVWIDQQAAQLARIEGQVTDDISVGIFLAKIYKGSHFLQERQEVAPGIWQATSGQYDFDGRKFLSGFSLHEHTSYWNYRLIGPPKQALASIRGELDKLPAAVANP
jgi:hypothetical protein